MKWNDDWRTECEENYADCYNRLCDCANTRKDILTIASLMYKYNPSMDKEDCLVRTLEWIGDWNNQYDVTDLTMEQYNRILHKM